MCSLFSTPAVIAFSATLMSLASSVATAEEYRVPAGPGEMIRPLVSFTGADTHVPESIQQRITSQKDWDQLWLQHTALAGRPQDYNQYRPTGAPQVDFEHCMVIAVTNAPGQINAGIIALDVRESDDRITFGFKNLYYQAMAGTSAPGNAYGFFVMPRSAKPIQFRVNVAGYHTRIEEGDPVWEDATLLPALARSQVSTIYGIAEPQEVDDSTNHIGWHIVFGQDPGAGRYDGVVGRSDDVWNFVSVGTTSIATLRDASGRETDVGLELSAHDGCWGITDVTGTYHAYVYHNCQCVDLVAQVTGLPNGRYAAYVYAHGDAPNQNAAIELAVGDEVYGRKSTLNDESWNFRSTAWEEGNQYVRFDFTVTDEEPLRLTSFRDGSEYSMFNAIQIVPLKQ